MIPDNSAEVGDIVSTPEGVGKVVSFDDRYVTVDLKDKYGSYEYRELELVKQAEASAEVK